MADLRETAVDPMTGRTAQPVTPPGYDPTFAESAMEQMLKLYGRFADRQTMPTNRRIFLETVVENARTPITEKDFAPAELDYMKSLIAKKYDPIKPFLQIYEDYLTDAISKDDQFRKQKKKDKILRKEYRAQYEKDLSAIKDFNSGKLSQDFLTLTSNNPAYATYDALKTLIPSSVSAFNIPSSVTYKDYGSEKDVTAARYASSGASPQEAVQLTLGQFNYAIDPQTGQLAIKENYDFNPPVNFISGQAQPMPPVGAESVAIAAPFIPEGGGDVAYQLLRQYAGRKVPPGYGRPVNINLGTGLASSAVPPVFPTYGQ